ncbi:exported hypothetical protein [Flavobacterium sp. 9AF]|uniref:hypothetical protein n=1 Tax=Flavobacterium sp. 9AF TaxID=2653142 RepID=UPI0012F3C645|nr:hypothetical protein [Flavobacterium sp. 9AF]VXC39775.1 exported hypothetical protein [Flavobacterium sp. 9AF]
MKSKILKMLTVLCGLFLLISCSKDDEPQTTEPDPNKALIGLFDITLNGNIEANLLFEANNKVTYGFATIYDMAAQPGRRATYTIDANNLVKFSTTDGATTFNYKATYEPSTGKLLNGTYGVGTSFDGSGSFTGKKYTPEGTGFPLLKGYWVGKWIPTTGSQKNFFVTLEENNSLAAGYDGATLFAINGNVCRGSYTLTGNTIASSFNDINAVFSYSITGTYDPTTKKITGTYGWGTNNSDLGTFYLEPKNYN